jgi:tRNA 2-thiouridine synthesizing protein A
MSCPLPIIKLAELMKTMGEGQVLRLLADDAGALEDIPAWCRRTGNPLISIVEEEGVIVALIRKK